MDMISEQELAELLVETGHHHHEAYITSDGVDPEWALWYAAHIQIRLFGRVESLPTRSQLIHLLIQAEKDFLADPGDGNWPPAYAKLILGQIN